MALNLTSFPISTSDGTASESSVGLCPAMYPDVTTSGNTAVVNSEYGVRKAIGDSLSDALSGINYGLGAPVYAGNSTDPLNVYADVRSVTSYSPRFVFQNEGNGLVVGYDGSYGSSFFSVRPRGQPTAVRLPRHRRHQRFLHRQLLRRRDRRRDRHNFRHILAVYCRRRLGRPPRYFVERGRRSHSHHSDPL